MRYASIPLSETEFNTRYQLLADYVQANEGKTNRGIEEGLNNLSNGNTLKDLFVLNPDGKSFLHKAAVEENLRLIDYLKTTGHPINLLDTQYKTPLYDACNELKLASVDALLNYGADPNLGDSDRTLPGARQGIAISYQGENVPLVAAIESTAMVTAAELSEVTSQDFSQLTDEQATNLAAAIIVKSLIEKRARIDLQTGIENFSALHRAIYHRKSLLVKAIADAPQAKTDKIFSQFDRDGEAALHMVVAYRSKEEKENEQAEMQEEKAIADIIIAHTESISVREPLDANTPLHAAVICSNIDVVEAIYKNDYKFFNDLKLLSMQNKKGNTAIHEAVKEAWRGPKILAFLMSIAMPDDLAIVNNEGETVGQIADRFLREADPVRGLVEEVEAVTEALELILEGSSDEAEVSVKEEIKQLYMAIHHLEEHEPFDERVSEELTEHLDGLLFTLKHYEDHASFLVKDVKNLADRSRQLVIDAEDQFFHESYLDSLKNVKQEKCFAWKAKQFQLPSSFPNLETIDTSLLYDHTEHVYVVAKMMYGAGVNSYNRGEYQAAIAKLKTSVNLYKPLYSMHHSLADAHIGLASAYLAENDNVNVPAIAEANNIEAQINLEEGIEIYHTLKDYRLLERAYQTLAKTYISAGELAIANYEAANRNKLSSQDNQEKLQGHLALAGLYKELKEQAFVSHYYSMNDLQTRESFHYHQVYTLTQGDLDNSAHVVLQREIGIDNDANLGTGNIQQCVVVVAFEPISKKVVLLHFDKASGPASFMDQLVNEFPGQAEVYIYISGGRDRVTLASTQIVSKISDNNIDQVLNQIYLKNVESSADGNPENGRFTIKTCDVGDKPSPEAIVFDARSQRLAHAMPNHADDSLESRKVNFLLQENKADYLRPPNRVDFTKPVAERKINFSPEKKQQIEAWFTQFTKQVSQTDAWNHDQVFYSLMIINNQIQIEKNNLIERINTDFTQGLFTERLNSLRSHYLGVPLVKAGDDNPPIFDVEDMNERLRCLGDRRRRDADHCVLDSEHLLEKLRELSEAEQSEVLEQVATRRVGGSKQKEIATLVNNQKITHHLQTVGGISSSLMDGLFAEEAFVNALKGDASSAIQLGGLKELGYALAKMSASMDAKGLEWLAAGKELRARFLRGLAPFASRGTSLFIGLDFYRQYKDFQKDPNNTDALIAAVGDGIQIGTDLVTAGIEVAEISSETFALMGISAAMGPVGEIIFGIVMLTDRAYQAVEAVARENRFVHLTGWEKVKEGGLALLSMDPEASIKKMIDEVTEYRRILLKQLEFLKSHPEIKHIIFPAIEKQGETCRIVIGERSCSGGGPILPPTCTHEKTVCDPNFTEIKDNYVYFKDKLIGFTLTREEITPPMGSELLCVPTGEGKSLPAEGAYACDGALGLTNINHTGNTAFYNLGEGEDHAVGFENIPNVFMVSNGAKDYEGGTQDDVYIVHATQVRTALPTDREGNGGLNGAEGSDSLTLSGFQPATNRTEINLNEGYLKDGNNTLALTSIEKVVGGTFPSSVTAACSTEEIDTGGGPTLSQPDIILIPRNASCDYHLKMHLRPNTNVTNEAEVGDFTYYILPGKGLVSINLTATEASLNTQQQFVFNGLISNVSSIAFSRKSADDEQLQAIKLHFLKNATNTTIMEEFKFELQANLSNKSLYFLDNAELKLGNKNLYFFQQDLNEGASEIMDRFSRIARLLNLICFLRTKDGESIVIGHRGKEVMYNNPVARTHLNGNGGGGFFVIKSGMEFLLPSRLPLSEVVLYRCPEDTHIDSLDFRELSAQVQAETNSTAKLFFVTPNHKNNLGHDMLIIFGIVKPSMRAGTIIEVITVRLKDAFLNHWYKKYLHIILEVAPQQIVGRHTHLHLRPIPLEFESQHEIAKVGIKDVEENTDLIIPQAYQAGAFFHHKRTNLLWTNRLNNISNQFTPFTLIMDNFYQEPRLKSLSLQFTDKKIVLKNKLAEIYAAEDFEEAKDTRLTSLRAESLAMMSSKQLDADNNIPTSAMETWLDKHADEIENEITPFRRRREIEHLDEPGRTNAAATQFGILQAVVSTVKSSMHTIFSNDAQKNSCDKTLEIANDFYDKQDQMKASVRKKVAKQFKRKPVETLQLKPANNAKQVAPTRRPVKNSALYNKTHKQVDRVHTMNTTVKANPLVCIKQKQTQLTFDRQALRSHHQTFHVNSSTIKNSLAGVNLIRGIENKPESFSRSQSLVQTRLAGHRYQQHNNYQQYQQAEKSGISKITAHVNTQGLLLLGHCMFISKPQAALNPKVVRFHQWEERRIRKEQGSQRLYIPNR
jgi:ankyrin repeat protein